MASVLFWIPRLNSYFRTITSNAPQVQKKGILSCISMQKLLCSPFSRLLIKKKDRKKEKVAFVESEMMKDLKIGILFLAGTKRKKSRTEASKAVIKMFLGD